MTHAYEYHPWVNTLYMQTNENVVDGTRDVINAYTGNFDSDVELSNEWTALDKSVISKPESNDR